MILDSLPPFVTFLLPTARFPFRQRHSSTTNSSSTTLTSCSVSQNSGDTTMSTSTSDSMLEFSTENSLNSCHTSRGSVSTSSSCSFLHPPRLHPIRRHQSTLRCLKCSTDLAYTSQILSKGFTGRLGRAYLVAPPLPPPFIPTFPPKPRPKSELVNTRTERPVSRELMTGLHLVADVSCLVCATVVGWKYIDTHEDSQRYKIGKVILERERVCVAGSWEDEELTGDMQVKNDAEVFKEWGDKQFDSSIQFDSDDEEECESLFAGVWDRDVVARKRKGKLKIGVASVVPSTTYIQNSP